jgi:hypothetical protein
VTEKYKRKPNAKCFVCRKLIYRRPSEIAATKNKVFCSSSCYGVSCRKEIPCAVCGKLLLSGLNKKTCSRACSNKNRAGIFYTGKSTKDNAVSIRHIKIKLVAIRGGVCERCGYNKREVLQVHHKDRNRKNNKITNLELVCPNCHYEEHYL